MQPKKWGFLTRTITSEIKNLFHTDVSQELKTCLGWLLLLGTKFLKDRLNPLDFQKSIFHLSFKKWLLQLIKWNTFLIMIMDYILSEVFSKTICSWLTPLVLPWSDHATLTLSQTLSLPQMQGLDSANLSTHN